MPETKATALLKTQELSVQIGDAHILKGINWQVNTGEHWAILGANGCGKTSLLAAITAYLTPSKGDVFFMGEAYGETDWNEVRHKIGMVSSALARRVPADEPAIETVLSGESAQLGYWTREKQVDARKARRCLSKMGVRSLENRPWVCLVKGTAKGFHRPRPHGRSEAPHPR
jgi:ABC-type molybdenum transport system, ATPase component/photorepair protein PhrA